MLQPASAWRVSANPAERHEKRIWVYAYARGVGNYPRPRRSAREHGAADSPPHVCITPRIGCGAGLGSHSRIQGVLGDNGNTSLQQDSGDRFDISVRPGERLP